MLKPLPVLMAVCAFALSARAGDGKPASLTDEEQKAGWKLLFDGASTKGWRVLGGPEFPKKGWDVVEGCLHHQPKGGGGDITRDEAFENFELTIEWKIAPGANSGIKYRVIESPGKSGAFGPEYQVIDDDKQPGGRTSKTSTASLYDVFPPAADKKLKPVGEFNLTRILAQGNHVEHWLNGEKTVEYEYGNDAWKDAVAKSKFKTSATFGKPVKAQICLQDHGDEVWYRAIKIRELPAK